MYQISLLIDKHVSNVLYVIRKIPFGGLQDSYQVVFEIQVRNDGCVVTIIQVFM